MARPLTFDNLVAYILIDPRGNHVNIEVLSKAKDKVSADIKNTIKSRGFVKLRIPNKKVVAEIEETINELNIRVSVDTKDMKVYNGILDYPVYLLHHKVQLDQQAIIYCILLLINMASKMIPVMSMLTVYSGITDYGKWRIIMELQYPSDTNHPQKICFIKTDILTNYRGDQDVVLANLIKHELGHAFGILRHYKGKQIMNDQADMGDAKLDFSKLNKADIQRDVFDRISIYKFQKAFNEYLVGDT
ncbi:MAG: hypothetical protein WDO71_24395 [Bacteroidota bacterium]